MQTRIIKKVIPNEKVTLKIKLERGEFTKEKGNFEAHMANREEELMEKFFMQVKSMIILYKNKKSRE